MSDDMLFGVLRMPYEIAMATELSRRQFYDRAQLALADADALRQFVEFALWVLDETRDDYIGSDLNGGDIQDKAEALGILEHVKVYEPCGDNCRCVEYYDSDEWPVICLRASDLVRRAREAIGQANRAQSRDESALGNA